MNAKTIPHVNQYFGDGSIRNVLGEGNCMLHAICAFLKIPPVFHDVPAPEANQVLAYQECAAEQRSDLARFMQNSPEYAHVYSPWVAVHGQPLDEKHLEALAVMHGINIIAYKLQLTGPFMEKHYIVGGPIAGGSIAGRTASLILVGNGDKSHWDWVVRPPQSDIIEMQRDAILYSQLHPPQELIPRDRIEIYDFPQAENPQQGGGSLAGVPLGGESSPTKGQSGLGLAALRATKSESELAGVRALIQAQPEAAGPPGTAKTPQGQLGGGTLAGSPLGDGSWSTEVQAGIGLAALRATSSESGLAGVRALIQAQRTDADPPRTGRTPPQADEGDGARN